MMLLPIDPMNAAGPVPPMPEIAPPEQVMEVQAIQDRMEIPEVARIAAEALKIDPIRMECVEECRRLVETGAIESPERLEAAIQAFLSSPDAQAI